MRQLRALRNRSSYPAKSGVSSTPRLFDSIAGVSGTLDHRLSRMMTAAGSAADSNCQTAEPITTTSLRAPAKQSMRQQGGKSGLLRRFTPRNDVKIHQRILAARCSRGVHESFAFRTQRAKA